MYSDRVVCLDVCTTRCLFGVGLDFLGLLETGPFGYCLPRDCTALAQGVWAKKIEDKNH